MRLSPGPQRCSRARPPSAPRSDRPAPHPSRLEVLGLIPARLPRSATTLAASASIRSDSVAAEKAVTRQRETLPHRPSSGSRLASAHQVFSPARGGPGGEPPAGPGRREHLYGPERPL